MALTTLRLRRYWDRQAAGYDRQMVRVERRFFADTRAWVCTRAVGEVLEVAVGTGLNLDHFPASARLTGVELSPAMLAVARDRARRSGRDVRFVIGDARSLPFGDASFDTVVCTFSMCAVPDERHALVEMARVLRPGGLLLLADHVESTAWYARALQYAADLVTVPLSGEHYRRRPARRVRELGFAVDEHDRFALGIIERLVARKPR